MRETVPAKKPGTVNIVCHNSSCSQEGLGFLEAVLKEFIFEWMHKTVDDIWHSLKSYSFPCFYFLFVALIFSMCCVFSKMNI